MGQAPISPKLIHRNVSNESNTSTSRKKSIDSDGSERIRTFDSKTISRSWLDVLSAAQTGEDGSIEVHGMTVFQNCFFEELAKVDPTGTILKLLSSCPDKTKVGNKFPGYVLMIIVRGLVSIENTSRPTINYLQTLGRNHQRRQIFRSHADILFKALFETIRLRLGAKATTRIMCAWQEVGEFCADKMFSTTYHFYCLHASSSSSNLGESSDSAVTAGDIGVMPYPRVQRLPSAIDGTKSDAATPVVNDSEYSRAGAEDCEMAIAPMSAVLSLALPSQPMMEVPSTDEIPIFGKSDAIEGAVPIIENVNAPMIGARAIIN